MKKLIITFLFLTFISSCAKDGIEIDREAEFYRLEGQNYAAKKKYGKAAEYYEQALSRADTPDYAERVQLALADSYFLNGDYVEAIASYELFIDVYKDSAEYPLALSHLAIAYYNIVRSVKKDQTYAERSMQYLLEIKKNYPSYVKPFNVDQRIKVLRNHLAEREYSIARYYWRILKTDSEIERYRYVVENYSDTKFFSESCYLLIDRLLNKKNLLDEAESYYDLQKNTVSLNDKYLSKSAKEIAAYKEKQAKKLLKK